MGGIMKSKILLFFIVYFILISTSVSASTSINKLENKDYNYACLNMGLLLIAQLLTLNMFYFMMLAYVFYCAKKYYHLEILSTIKKVTFKQSFFFGGGSMIVMGMSAICLFATLRLM